MSHNYCKDIRDWRRILTWKNFAEIQKGKLPLCTFHSICDTYERNDLFNAKVCIFMGDITTLKVDAIVNAADKTLLGNDGGVTLAIHRAAGPELLKECMNLRVCEIGESRITKGCNLPAKNVIHTVGPVSENETKLIEAYRSALDVAIENNCKSIAFPCISTGFNEYPCEEACFIALKVVRQYLEIYSEKINCIIFCVFSHGDHDIYLDFIQYFFPVEDQEEKIQFDNNSSPEH